MSLKLSAFIGRRYTRSKRRSELTSFISLVSMLGLAISVALLIVVLSIMNGFEQEMRQRILGLIPHITVQRSGGVNDWQSLAEQLQQNDSVSAVSPYLRLEGMLVKGARVEAALVLGVEPEVELATSIIGEFVAADVLTQLSQGGNGLIVGKGLAEKLQLAVNDKVNLVVPQDEDPGQRSAPKILRFQVLTILHTGTELDNNVAIAGISFLAQQQNAEQMFGGVKVAVKDVFSAPQVAWELSQQLNYTYQLQDWTRSHGNLYTAIEMSRRLVAMMLVAIIAVAVFNVISSLVMAVNDKQGDIAILRTMGASPKTITQIFMVQGVLIGLIGTATGAVLGLLAAWGIGDLVAWLEQLFGMQLLHTDVYPVDYLPVDIRFADVLLICGTALLMSFLATIYPSRRAAKLQPATVLSRG